MLRLRLGAEETVTNDWKKIRNKFLSTLYLTNDLCKDSDINQCLEKSHSLFQFSDFNNVTFIEKLGKPSENGFIYRLQYSEPSFNLSANAILKSSRKKEADNLVYEYWAGLYVNKIRDNFPCFLQTYGLYKYENEESWMHACSKKTVDLRQLSKICSTYDKHGECQPTDICSSAKFFSILLQYVENPISMFDYIVSAECNAYELSCILFIIYMALDQLKDGFTHYDFHDENCLVYSPYDKYIHYQYHLSNGERIEFYTKYVPKIIDYGLAYYDGNDGVIKKLHEYSDCNDKNDAFTQRAGKTSGFGSLTNCTTGNPRDKDYICSNTPNRSHDLRLLYLIQTTPAYIEEDECPHLKGYPKDFDVPDTSLRLKDILSEVFQNATLLYGYKNKNDQLDKGTPEEMTPKEGKIVNVSDAHTHFKDYLSSRSPVPAEDVPPPDEIAGEMHVYYDNKPILFRKR